MTIAQLLREADELGLGWLLWEDHGNGWSCRAKGLRVSHRAQGSSAHAALWDLVDFARRVLR